MVHPRCMVYQNGLEVLDTTLPPADPKGNEEGQAHSAGVEQQSLHADLKSTSSTIPLLDEIGGGINVNRFTFTVPGPTGKTFKLSSITPWLPTIKSYVPVASQISFQVSHLSALEGRNHSLIGNFSIMSTWQGVITHALATSPSCQHGGMCLAEHERYDDALQLVALKRIPAIDTSTGDSAATAVVEKKELDEAVIASNSCCRRGRVRSADAVINLSTHPNILLQ
ncbi:uncharacterized protein F5891DRAFT_1245735 [Suillus fuscotomentosus]|uniref:Uncharacterized protein n=1 Tax=Suillus fuscotomentosus TaxID=1912939 RepID=A0AAD4E1I3_9AGAM|nr:uncharacterized protein F5891DRAFT_1245735 [Suillus fuscotomentosus]KAG1896749.1 hypothetical protein F5891DRAFT_1245735 [Suillus fuscotomentosus]